MITPLDEQRIRRQFEGAAVTYGKADFLQREIGMRLLQRLASLSLDPRRILDLGAGTGADSRHLAARYPDAALVALDVARPMLAQGAPPSGVFPVCADAQRLPFVSNSIDLVYSNLMLQWIGNLEPLFDELRRIMRPGGVLLFSSFGPDTLMELRASWAQADGSVHVHEFVDMHHVGDALVNAGFADPVMDAERLMVDYDEVSALMRDLKAIGAQNAAQERRQGLTGKARFQRVARAYERHRAHGKLPATYEVVYGYAVAPGEGRPRRTAGGQEAAFSVETLRRSIKSSSGNSDLFRVSAWRTEVPPFLIA